MFKKMGEIKTNCSNSYSIIVFYTVYNSHVYYSPAANLFSTKIEESINIRGLYLGLFVRTTKVSKDENLGNLDKLKR